MATMMAKKRLIYPMSTVFPRDSNDSLLSECSLNWPTRAFSFRYSSMIASLRTTSSGCVSIRKIDASGEVICLFADSTFPVDSYSCRSRLVYLNLTGVKEMS